MKQRILAFLTAFCMVLALLPVQAFAAELPAEPQEKALSVGSRFFQTRTNPLYGGDEPSDILAAPQLYASEGIDPDTYLSADVDVLTAIASGLEQRQATITVPWMISVSDASTEDDLLAMIYAALLLAMSHTGVPTQGDYLLWHYETVRYGGQIDAQDEDYVYIQAIYEVTYYTTAEQEAELTTKLTEIMNSFGFTAETDDYTKVKAIYDYICANVSYDYNTLEDDTYTLKFTAYAALVNKTAVCQGYATLLYRMLLTAGVDTRVIAGDAGGAHAWNITKLGDMYYNLDSTWDAGQTEYSYFLKSPTNFTDHTRDEAYESTDFHTAYPMATADYVPGEAHTHSVTPVAAEPATCTESGTKAHYICSCGKLFADAEATEEVQAADLVVAATGHTWGDWVQTTPPTETEKGEDTRECSVCHDTETREVPALGHICANHLTAKAAVPATCTETGTKAHYICSCDKLYSDADATTEVQAADLVVAATGHTKETIPAVAPTCTETGLTEGKKCSVCGEILTAQAEIPATGHTYVNGACTVCGAADPGIVPGDFTGDDVLTDDDAIYLLWHTLFPELYPIGNDGDLTGDGLVTDDDAIYLLWHTLFPELYPLYTPATVSTTSDERGKKK